MKRTTASCCESGSGKNTVSKEMELPEQIKKELEDMGGFEALASQVPSKLDLEEKSRIHHALSDPIRLTILHLIQDHPLCVCVIIRFLSIGGSKLSYHLNILKESGLIEGEYHGNWNIYSITEKGRRFIADSP